jgi:hypothetical protein
MAPPAAAGGPRPATGDPGFIPVRRLNNTEYDATVRDLLGLDLGLAGSTFVADEELHGFDSIAAALRISDARYLQYYEAAERLADDAFQSREARARILHCTPAADGDEACTRAIIERFGLRAWRRPLKGAEVDRLLRVAREARTAGETPEAAVRQVVQVMLAAPPFLYHLPASAPGETGDLRRLDAFSLASRLSYLLWGTMPDDDLLEAARDGSLLNDATLSKHLDRMVRSPRVRGLVTGFAAQWLGNRKLESHQVESAVYPSWDDPLRQAMLEEANTYVASFLDKRPLSAFFTTDVNFVNDRLAKHYGFSGSFSKDKLVEVERREDQRRGFLGLGSFLTVTSFSYRTAPTIRGTWILENLLCEHIPLPPPMIDELDTNMPAEAVQSQNVRERLEQHRKDPGCAACHNIVDPFGLGLEAFDAIGRHRRTYPNGDRVDATGALPDGTRFDGLLELSEKLAQDQRFASCVVEKTLTYALSRGLEESDHAFQDGLRTRWLSTDQTLRSLLAEVVQSVPFRYHRTEPAAMEARR